MNGKLDKHGDFEMEEIDLYVRCSRSLFRSLMSFFQSVENHKVDYFVELCECYSLPSSGTKTARWDHLVKFSQAGDEPRLCGNSNTTQNEIG